MKLLGLCLSLSLVTVLTAIAELDLSPQPDLFELDGIKIPQLIFDNGRLPKVSYQPPQDWKYSGQKDQLVIQPDKLSQASARMVKLPENEVITLDQAGREQLKREALLSLPNGSEDAEVRSEQVDPMQINGLHTYLIELKYVFFGEKFACYSLTVNRKPRALNFRLTCRERDYKELRKAFEKSLYTWQNL